VTSDAPGSKASVVQLLDALFLSRTVTGQTPLHLAGRMGHAKAAAWICDAGAQRRAAAAAAETGSKAGTGTGTVDEIAVAKA